LDGDTLSIDQENTDEKLVAIQKWAAFLLIVDMDLLYNTIKTENRYTRKICTVVIAHKNEESWCNIKSFFL
jgi:hypothetical protein